VLLICLKRFDSIGNKIEKQVSFDLNLDLELSQGYDSYRLIGVVKHVGRTIIHGHYICYTKTDKDVWNKISDDIVSTVSEAEVLNVQAYILLYEKNTEQKKLELREKKRIQENKDQEVKLKQIEAEKAEEQRKKQKNDIALLRRQKEIEDNRIQNLKQIEAEKAEEQRKKQENDIALLRRKKEIENNHAASVLRQEKAKAEQERIMIARKAEQIRNNELNEIALLNRRKEIDKNRADSIALKNELKRKVEASNLSNILKLQKKANDIEKQRELDKESKGNKRKLNSNANIDSVDSRILRKALERDNDNTEHAKINQKFREEQNRKFAEHKKKVREDGKNREEANRKNAEHMKKVREDVEYREEANRKHAEHMKKVREDVEYREEANRKNAEHMKKVREDDEYREEEKRRRDREERIKSNTECDRLNSLTYFDNLNAYYSNDKINRNPYYYHKKFPDSNNNYNWFRALRSETCAFKKTSGYQSLELYWDKSCDECDAKYLNESSRDFRSKCCYPVESNDNFPKFKELIPALRELANNEEFCRNSQCYNNRLAFGATGVDNDEGTYDDFENYP
jgi:hypothetical protein